MIIRPTDKGMMLHTMYFVDELHEANQTFAGKAEKFDKKELDLAKQLINSLASPFHPEQFEDEYRKNVEKLITTKRNREESGSHSTAEDSARCRFDEGAAAEFGPNERNNTPRRQNRQSQIDQGVVREEDRKQAQHTSGIEPMCYLARAERYICLQMLKRESGESPELPRSGNQERTLNRNALARIGLGSTSY